jgi:transglutaminase-like putative cysteine protease
MGRYLKPTEVIDCDTSSIIEKAQSLTKGQREEIGKAKSLFYFVRDEIKYNPYLPNDLLEYHKASATLKRGEGYCIQKAILLTALARAVGIPARLGFAAIRNYLMTEKLREMKRGNNLFVCHGYCELYLGGRWVKATPTFDLGMCQEHGFIPVEFDGKSDATFPRYDREGRWHIEYVRDHGQYDDLPADKILRPDLEFLTLDDLDR